VTRRILSREDGRGGYLLGVRDSGLYFSRYGDGAWSTAHAALPADGWTHVAATFDGQAMRLYVNGRREQSVPSLMALGPGGAVEPRGQVGRLALLRRRLDEVAVYDGVLLGEQVAQHHRAGRGE
jgi:hypothetical protein